MHTDESTEVANRRNGRAWVAGIIAAFALVFFANGMLVYFALDTAPEIVESYESEQR